MFKNIPQLFRLGTIFRGKVAADGPDKCSVNLVGTNGHPDNIEQVPNQIDGVNHFLIVFIGVRAPRSRPRCVTYVRARVHRAEAGRRCSVVVTLSNF